MPDMIQKPIAFSTPADISTRHSTHLVSSPLPGRYLLTFFECLPPLIIGNTDAEKQAEWAKIKEIPAVCVARLVIAEADMGGFIQVLQQQQAQVKQQALGGFKAFT